MFRMRHSLLNLHNYTTKNTMNKLNRVLLYTLDKNNFF